MNIHTLKESANHRLDQASYPAKKLSLIHAAVALGGSLLVTILGFFLDRSMENATGLGGLGTRAALESVRTVLQFALTVALPFWELGALKVWLLIADEKPADPSVLTAGFHKFAPALRLMLLRLAAVMLIAFGCIQLATTLYMMTPMSDGLMNAMESLLDAGASLDMDTAAGLMDLLIPVYILSAVVFLGVLIPLFYRFRLSDFAMMDDAPGALAALRTSGRATKGKCLQLLRLDLSFWWYYALQALASTLYYGDVISSALGMSINQDLSFFLFTILGIFAQLALFWQFAPKVQTAYALAFLRWKTQTPSLPENLS